MKHRFFCLFNLTNNPSRSPLGRILLGWTLMMSLALTLGSPAAHAQAYAEQTLHHFQGQPTDGYIPDGTLILVNGTLYGTTLDGGINSTGTIFSVKPDGTGYQTLYSFTALNNSSANTDGAQPVGGLINVNGTLYGTTQDGGSYGKGVVFTFDPSTSTQKAVYSFYGGTTNGANPQASLTLVNGLLYGTTPNGGANSKGIVFSIDTFSYAVNTIYSFGATTSDAAYPYGSLIAVNGILYGTTFGGGSLSYGTVFAVDPTAKTEHVLHTFTGTNINFDGSSPYSELINVNGNLYGTTYAGGMDSDGTIFCLNTNGGDYQTLYSFTYSVGDGANPVAGLININGTLYGTTRFGGYGYGTVFSWNPATQAETTLYRLTATDSSGHNADGANPYAGLLNINNTLYGATQFGGTNGYGTLFSLTPVVLPTAKNETARGIANHTITVTAPGVLGNDNNGGDPNTTAAVVSNPTHGTLAFNSNGSFTYKPNANFVGNDSFTYKDTNLAGTSNTATCTIAIGPIAYDDLGRTYFNTPITINAPGVLANDTTGGIATTAALVTNPSHGTITFNSNGSFTYTPTSGFQGTDTFTYKITSAGGTSAPATCTMTVQSRTPVANNDSGRLTHNTTLTITAPGVMGNDNLGSTGTVTASLVTNVSHGTLTFNSNGSFVYKPTTGYIGTDSFTYKDTNSVGTSNTATCTITVQ